ncbi:MAG: type II toxin-antitoxin system HicB family antitoxin [bacterium]|nr:type II toxin-antitoxin system HicB family antitoxin [bacterium]
MHRTYRVIIDPDTKGYHGYVPALRGCHTWGRTVTQTKAHLREAISVYIESLLAHGEEVPEERSLESFETVELRQRAPRRVHRRTYA